MVRFVARVGPVAAVIVGGSPAAASLAIVLVAFGVSGAFFLAGYGISRLSAARR